MSEPLPICHLNGQLLPLRAARISPLDRSFLFGDGVYEVIAVHGGHAPQLAANIARLARSLAELKIRNPYPSARWAELIGELAAANGGGDLYVYLQVSRGSEYGRNHAPLPDIEPTVFGFCAPLPPTPPELYTAGLSCITAADTRWARCDIKSVALLANVLLRQQALDAGAAEAILLRDGWLTDASASAVHVVIAGEIRTPPRSQRLLPGTTRGLIEELAAAHAMPCTSSAVSEAELRGADEIWLSAATRGVVPVTRLDGQPVGDGRPGPVWQRMRALVEASWRPRLAFPCAYPIKVMMRAEPAVRTHVDAIFARHADATAVASASERPSAQGNFCGVTYTITARDEQQIAALFADLKTVAGVLLVL